MNNELLFNLLLPHLSIDVVYRLYPFTNVLRKMVDNRFYWIKLIEQDLKMIPKFEINPKLHYLRMMNYPIAGSLTTPHLDRNLKVLQYLEGVILYRHNQVDYKGTIISLPEAIKFIRKVLGRHYLISYSGKVYQLGTHTPTKPVNIFGSEVLDLGGIAVSSLFNAVIVITHQGGLKLIRYMDGNLKEVVHDLDSKAIQVRGNYVMTELGSVYIITMYDITKIDTIVSTTSFLPAPYYNNYHVIIDYQVLMRKEDNLTLYNPRTQRYTSVNTSIKKDGRFVDPLGNNLAQMFYYYIGEGAILEVCDTRDDSVILRTL